MQKLSLKIMGYHFLFISVSLHVLVESMIPSLIVKRLDKTLIARKRQDTMEMCRMFTEENLKDHQDNHVPRIIQSYRPIIKEKILHKRDVATNEKNSKRGQEHQRHRRGLRYRPITKPHIKMRRMSMNVYREHNPRLKREATMKYAVNPALNAEDSRRVESIVDKLYDDLEEKGQRITYRQVETTNSGKLNSNKTFQPSRRFDFAPAVITGPQPQHQQLKDPADIPFASKAKWKLGIVPYFIDSKTYDAHLTEIIMKAFDYFEKATCIRLQKLREKPTDKKFLEDVPWVYISNPTGIRQCVHTNERLRINGVQLTVFGYDCMSVGDIVHEVMHILGYSHEHLRSNREQYISVLWDNIKPGYKKYFDRNMVSGVEYDLSSLPYDYTSILHYPPRAFSRNGKATILAEPGIKIGQREGLSEIDIEKVALIYSNECVTRNREYLLKTCPSVVKSVTRPTNISETDIKDYFKDRIWKFGIISYKLRDNVEFSIEERENIKAVFRHIEDETCLRFRDVGVKEDDDDAFGDKGETENDDKKPEDTPETVTLTTDDNTPEQKIETSEPEVDTTEPDIDTTEPDIDTTAPDVFTTETTAVIESDTDLPINNGNISPESHGKHLGNIIFLDSSVITKEKPDEIDKKDLRENEIHKNDGENVIPLAKQEENKLKSLDKKRYFIRKVIANRMKQESMSRRDSNSVPPGTRRHANAILVLKRSPAADCQCPEPGPRNGENVLEIGAGCFNSVNDLLHFFVHVLGLDHQHNMHDRDNYLHIVWQNLTTDVRQEMKEKLPPAASVDFPYDYQSVMHYPWLQIKNGKTNVMYPIWNDGWAMGHWQGLSSIDVQKLNQIYRGECKHRQEQERDN